VISRTSRVIGRTNRVMSEKATVNIALYDEDVDV